MLIYRQIKYSCGRNHIQRVGTHYFQEGYWECLCAFLLHKNSALMSKYYNLKGEFCYEERAERNCTSRH